MKVFELYSGIGGMHFALKESGVNGKIVRAIDINPTANAVYKHNFQEGILQEKNIQGLSEVDFNIVQADMIMMSPPCQPYTRTGLKKDAADARTNSLFHVLTLIPKLETLRFILLENVQGFEVSEVRNEVIKTLSEAGFIYQEFLLTPVQFGVPNSRLRYYLLAKKKPLQFCFVQHQDVLESLPKFNQELLTEVSKLLAKYKQTNDLDSCFPIEKIISMQNESKSLIPDKILKKYGTIFDIVTSSSTKSCCFTKAYSHYVEGTGSVYCPKSQESIAKTYSELETIDKDSCEYVEKIKELELRYFTPREIARLMCFPEDMDFPNHLTPKQKYRVLGNSINVHVVAVLVRLLVS